tara:strand:+ start:3246 stop:3740 length:495 start_codon:yes stop_codon:yes gene_type:complete
MWVIAKYEKKKLNFFINNLKKNLGEDFVIYSPFMEVKSFVKNQVIKKKINILEDYIFCYSKKFSKKNTFNQLRYLKGLKYFLEGFFESQNEISEFIKKCKDSENINGAISSNFFELILNRKYKFNSGPFLNAVFKLVEIRKRKLKVLIGNKVTTINKDILVRPV